VSRALRTCWPVPPWITLWLPIVAVIVQGGIWHAGTGTRHHPSPRRGRGPATDLSTTGDGHPGQIPWPSPGRFRDRQRAVFMADRGRILVAVDMRCLCVGCLVT
jgi:hypothetical protein